MSRQRAKGTRWETAIVDYLRAAGWPAAERRALAGTGDRGDIAGVPLTVIEAKNCAKHELGAWIAEAETERDNDHSRYGVAWIKRRGKTSPADGYVLMTGRQFATLLADAHGLTNPAEEEVA